MNYPTRGSETVPYRYDLFNMVVWQDVPSVFRAIRADVNQGGRPLPERQNHLTRSREGREERDLDRLPNHLLASSLRVFAPSREKRCPRTPPINFLNDDRDAFWITPMIQNAPRFILDHPDDLPDHPDAIPDHRDAVLDVRNPSSDPRKRLRTALERRNEAPDSILDSRDPACDQKLDTSDVLEGAPDCIEVIQSASGCILNHRDDPKLHRGAFLNHRDDPELHPDDPELIGEDAKPAREDAGTVLDDPQMLRDDPGTDRDDPGTAP